MGANAALVLELAIVATQHATELQQLFQTATLQGRDVTDDELTAIRARAVAAIDALEASAKGNASGAASAGSAP